MQDLQHPADPEQLQGPREGDLLQGLLRRQAAALRPEQKGVGE